MDFKDMTVNFLDDDQYFNFVLPATGGAILVAKKIKKRALKKEEKAWALKFPLKEDPNKLDATINLARRKLITLPTNTAKDKRQKKALESYITYLEKYKNDLLTAIESENKKIQEEEERKVKEETEMKYKEEQEKKEKQEQEENEKLEKDEKEKRRLENNNKKLEKDDKNKKSMLYVGIGVGVIIIAGIFYYAVKNKQP
jgi:hypothetical protein